MTRSDRLLILALAVLALVTWPLVAVAGGSGVRVEISGPSGTSSVPLSEDRTLLVRGQRGGVSVVIEDGSVHVQEADCPDRVCVDTGAVKAAGAMIACVPNGVVVRVRGGEPDGFDARIR